MAKYKNIMQASLPGSLQSEELGFCFLEKGEHCLNILLKEGVSPGGFIHIFFQEEKTTRCFRHEMLLSSANLGVLFWLVGFGFFFVCLALIFKGSVRSHTCSLSYFS